MHYSRKTRHGDPRVSLRGHVQVFLREAATSSSEECIPFPFTGTNRFRTVSLRGKPMTAARAVWIIANGDVPEGLYVLHRCNFGSGANGCVNPKHLYLGTPGDNIRDSHADPRRKFVPPNATLTPEAVLEIRAGGKTDDVYAERFGVRPQAIRLARTGKTWKHL